MPPKQDLSGIGFSALSTSAFNPSDHDIDDDDAQRFENELPDGAVQSESEAFARFRMTIYEKNNSSGSTLTEHFREDFSNATDDVFRRMNGDLHKKFRNYLREHGEFIPRKKNVPIFTALASAVDEKLGWAALETNQVKDSVLQGCFPISDRQVRWI